ncbi:MAG: hypothetical protein KatS3mg007_1850 [Thermoanaerobaculum sp.]|nr:MAG: hypothetical protein KatS3mg007_1850 [Thermoanaerobaculum sp.]GBC80368.1 hypothetical protein HRbin09_01603 [bacterium HR09]
MPKGTPAPGSKRLAGAGVVALLTIAALCSGAPLLCWGLGDHLGLEAVFATCCSASPANTLEAGEALSLPAGAPSGGCASCTDVVLPFVGVQPPSAALSTASGLETSALLPAAETPQLGRLWAWSSQQILPTPPPLRALRSDVLLI